MKVKKIELLSAMSDAEKAGFIGVKHEGFEVVSLTQTQSGAVVFVYSYKDWDFNSTVLILPLADTGYCQIVKVD